MSTTEEEEKVQIVVGDLTFLGPGLFGWHIYECPTCKESHHMAEFKGKRIRIYDWSIVLLPARNERYIVLAFMWEGKSHLAYMGYDEVVSYKLSMYNEKFRKGYGVLFTPADKFWEVSLQG